MSWARNQVEKLITEFEKHPCLWAVQSKEYKNKHAKIKALEAIKSELGKIGMPSVSINDIKTKFHGLKSTFMTEYKKYEQSFKSGAGEDEIYYPTLWYFEIMQFVLEHNIPRKGMDNSDSLLNTNDETDLSVPISCDETQSEMPVPEPERNIIEEYDDIDNIEIINTFDDNLSEPEANVLMSPNKISNKQTPQIETPKNEKQIGNKNKRKKPDKLEATLEEASGAIKVLSKVLEKKGNSEDKENHEKKGSFILFGQFVSEKLSQMREDVANNIEEKITMLLYQGIRESKNL